MSVLSIVLLHYARIQNDRQDNARGPQMHWKLALTGAVDPCAPSIAFRSLGTSVEEFVPVFLSRLDDDRTDA